jgi:hypothetical protein
LAFIIWWFRLRHQFGGSGFDVIPSVWRAGLGGSGFDANPFFWPSSFGGSGFDTNLVVPALMPFPLFGVLD